MLRSMLVVTPPLFAALLACNAKLDDTAIQGGERRFTPTVPTAPEEDAGEEGTSALFSDLFRDYFGPTGRASCAGNGACHGTAAEAGSASSGFVCGSNASECRTSMLAMPLVLVAPGNVDTSYLVQVIRRRNAAGVVEGFMPKSPPFSYTFTERGMARIRAWIAEGAQDN